MKKRVFIALALITMLLSLLTPSASALTTEEKELTSFIKTHTNLVAPLEKEMNITEWNAYITGKKEDYEKKSAAALKLDKYYSNKESYKKLIAWEKSGNIKAPLLKRQLHLMINAFGPKQIDPALLSAINKKETELQRVFNNYRGELNGKKINEGEIYDILRLSNNRNERMLAWEAQKGVGPVVSKNLIELVKLRNEAAVQLGFKNYYEMQISFQDLSVGELENIFSKLVASTEKPFIKYKAELDKIRAEKLGLKTTELMPWDYTNPFFQAADGTFSADTETCYKERNLPLIDYNFYECMGLNLGNVLKNSDLYAKEGKSQHAFCYTMDRGKDIRILMNLKPNEDSFSTLLHESGHAVYSLNIDQNMPWLFRTECHIFTTEASAMFFERLTKNPSWLTINLGVKKEAAEKLGSQLKKDQILNDLIFCRWTVVMFNFEKALYENPDQDLDKLWWSLAEKYQHIKKPEGRNQPDWASKIHLVSAPVYYHNYMLGGLMVSQVLHTLGTKVLKNNNWTELDVSCKPEVGRWLRTNIYKHGTKYRWDELLERATGESLNPDYFGEQVNS